ncbi:hypothetical protein PROFUN_09083 [Planoprotostelium fungivorum]|uniref:Uncharacterized protein n=1 Tax=Planoprotostelium fungivorum TaxID=1890364 RepID=A0A2P6NII5_9EUKA|nr:hypothetical protein PROFUN_09083 [Planoprotostelium fungivorum]
MRVVRGIFTNNLAGVLCSHEAHECQRTWPLYKRIEAIQDSNVRIHNYCVRLMQFSNSRRAASSVRSLARLTVNFCAFLLSELGQNRSIPPDLTLLCAPAIHMGSGFCDKNLSG